MAERTRKIHIPHRTLPGRLLCGAQARRVGSAGRQSPAPLFIGKNQIVDEATCKRCWAADDAQQVRDYRRECQEAGLDPDTLEKIK